MLEQADRATIVRDIAKSDREIPREIPRTLDGLQDCIARLEEAVGTLGDRLEPVLAPPRESAGIDEPSEGFVTPVGVRIGKVSGRLEHLHWRVLDLLDRLAV
jgi:hypothetical protein